MPWDFDETRDKLRGCSAEQKASEEFIKVAYKDLAHAEADYRMELSKQIILEHDAGIAWSVAADVARGRPVVAKKRQRRDIAEGVVEAAKQRSYTAAADRKDAQGLATWSQRRELEEMR
jgi:hypothetical protein